MSENELTVKFDGDDQVVYVNVAGFSGSLRIKVESGHTVKDVLAEALERLGAVPAVIDQMGVVVNRADASLTDTVTTGDRVTAAPRVSNG